MTQYAWVIEAGWSDVSAPEYWGGVEGSGDGMLQSWSTNHINAVRFARREDAEKVAKCILHENESWRVAEHGWG